MARFLALALLSLMALAQLWGSATLWWHGRQGDDLFLRTMGAVTGVAGQFSFFSRYNWRPETVDYRWRAVGAEGPWRDVEVLPSWIWYRFRWQASYYLPLLRERGGEASLREHASGHARLVFQRHPWAQQTRVEIRQRYFPPGQTYASDSQLLFAAKFAR